jgi:serine/threonine-protein kinase
MTLAAGTRLGPYEVVARLGAGGMGEVYKATDTRLGRTVAIKVSREEFSERFEREARAVAALNHPNICQLYDVGPNYLVMEFVDGTPVEPPGDRARLLDVASQIADALIAAHAAGIVHRDLKPDNILVTRDGRVKVLDFGLALGGLTSGAPDALATQAATAAGTTVGTVAYMSPEQARGEVVDARSDLWSLGVVLYELATGVRPFGGATAAVVFGGILNQSPPPLRDSGAHVPSGLAPIVARLLEKDRRLRYQSAADLRSDLTRLAQPAAEGRAAESRPSIAVLPFASMSRDADDEYFSDGLAEEIINLLAQLPGLKVIARTSAFAFKGKHEDIRRIAETLGVTTALEGSVRRSGTRLRVTAQLIHAADGTHLWSQRYDREMADVFAMQDEIAAAIAEALKVKLAPMPERRMPKVAAYEAYLQYRFWQWQFTPDATLRSRECLERALALDPAFALPHVGLADSYLAAACAGALPAHEGMPKARELAKRALALDPGLPEAQAMLGIIAGHHEYDWDQAGRLFDLAMAREPLTPHMRLWHAWFYLLPVGRTDEAVAQMQRAIEDDPLGAVWHFFQAFALQAQGRHDEALASCRRGGELSPELWIMWWGLGLLHAIGGELEEAGHCADKAIAQVPWSGMAIGLSAGLHAASGRREKAQGLLAGLPEDAYGGPLARAFYWILQDDAEAAVDWLLKAADQRFSQMIETAVHPFASQLRGAPSWPALLAKLHLPV